MDPEFESSTGESKILSLCWSSGILAAAYYDIDQLEICAIQQAAEPRPQYALLKNLVRQYGPLFCLISGSKHFLDDIPELLELPEGTRMKHFNAGKIEPSEKARICDFGPNALKASIAKVLATNLPGMPAQASDNDRRMFIESVLPFDQELLVHAVGCLLTLLDRIASEDNCPVVTRINIVTPSSQMIIDELTFQALQIFNSRLHPSGFKRFLGSSSCSLYDLLNRCSSKIGREELKVTMQQPVRDLRELNQRLNTVQWLSKPCNSGVVREMRDLIGNLSKIQMSYRKIVTKVAKNSDWKSFKKNVYYAYLLCKLCKLCFSSDEAFLHEGPIEELFKFVAEPNNTLKQLLFSVDKIIDLEKGEQDNKFTVKRGVDQELDRMRSSIDETQMALLESSRLDLEHLPIDVDDLYVTYLPSYGFVFSTNYIDDLRQPGILEQSAMDLVLQSDTTIYFQNNVCRELNIQYSDILAAINNRELAIHDKLVNYINQVMPELLMVLKFIAKLDVLLAFASVAESQSYVRPKVIDEKILQIKQGRHPLLEQFKTYRPNDTDITSQIEKFVNIYASNKSTGKTIYLKEIALICYLAHIGCFVPAESATIGLLDSIYTRLDYPESIFSGKSSFMGELYQMSNILLNTTSKSLVLIDEFGKGTTYSEGKALLIASIDHLLQKTHQAPIAIVATQFNSIANYLDENQFLRVYTTQPNECTKTNNNSNTDFHPENLCQDLFNTVTQTITLTLIKKFVCGEVAEPAAVAELYKSVPFCSEGQVESRPSSSGLAKISCSDKSFKF
ncbi:mutS protein homolog 5-like [Toxorhynchites rutilus septentrionalis]|uniref:mutS protein homolog 5-like n=1 Tax=Toxorhynchites rutilus septentrionalis TaxID=329112 RepID=UPI002479A5CE|nr:mutS protein homolog 5-like [Toxorhynchites rutilus septentrionalis]